MSFKRIYFPEHYPKDLELTKRLISIGFRLTGNVANIEPNIEETLVAASLEGVDGDFRVLSLLVDWFNIHYFWINADLLTTFVTTNLNQKVHAFWTACAQQKKSDPRFRKLRNLYKGERVELISDPTGFYLQRNGEDPRFKNSCLLLPDKILRHRPIDIDSPTKLSKMHRAYRYRVMLGPTYRADLLATLEQDPNLSTSELARICYSSFSAAWETKKNFQIIHGS